MTCDTPQPDLSLIGGLGMNPNTNDMVIVIAQLKAHVRDLLQRSDVTTDELAMLSQALGAVASEVNATLRDFRRVEDWDGD
jgi:hypothetical protein